MENRIFSGWKYLHYLDFIGRKDGKNAVVKCKLLHYFTLALHVLRILQLMFILLTTYIMKYNCIWVTGELATISIKLHMIIHEINTTLFLKTHCKLPSGACTNNFRLRSNVDFGQLMTKFVYL